MDILSAFLDARLRVEQTINSFLNVNQFLSGNTQFWQDFLIMLDYTISERENASQDEIRVFFDEFNVTYPIFNASGDLLTKLLLDFYPERKLEFGGNFVVNVEGVVPWPAPDPDLEFDWKAEAELLNFNAAISFSITITFRGIQKPSLGWLFAIIGFLTGNQFGLGLLFGAGGIAVGEIIDRQYDNPENEARIIKGISSIYANAEYLKKIGIQIYRPNERSIKLTIIPELDGVVYKGLKAKGRQPEIWLEPVLHVMN